MKAKLDMKTIQALNLFNNITKVKADFCFKYNGMLVFSVSGLNINRLKPNQIQFLGKKLNSRIKIIRTPLTKSKDELESFVKYLVPYTYRKLELKEKELIFFIPGTRARALFIGRDKTRLNELTSALKNFFDIEKISIK